MMNYAICNETFEGWDWAETCHQIAELGYDGIELAPFTLTEDVRTLRAHARRVYANTARRAGLEVVGLHWLLVSPKGLSITGPEPSVRAATADYLSALVDFCADMGGRILVLGSPAQRRLPIGDPASNGTSPVELAAERLQTCLEPALERAAAHGITLCLEPLPPPESDFVLTLREAVTLVQRFNHPSLKTIFDVKSASSEGVPLPDLIRAFAPHIAHVHANDANRRGPGFGETDFVPVLATLREVGYAGYVSIEVFDYSPDPVTIAHDSLAYLRRCESARSRPR
jgi:sugar phosphate isomerase/epimerase